MIPALHSIGTEERGVTLLPEQIGISEFHDPDRIFFLSKARLERPQVTDRTTLKHPAEAQPFPERRAPSWSSPNCVTLWWKFEEKQKHSVIIHCFSEITISLICLSTLIKQLPVLATKPSCRDTHSPHQTSTGPHLAADPSLPPGKDPGGSPCKEAADMDLNRIWASD